MKNICKINTYFLIVTLILQGGYIVAQNPNLQNNMDKEMGKTLEIDSIYGFKSIKLEASYSSVKHLLSKKKEVLNKHEYTCAVKDSAYLKMPDYNIQSIKIDFFDNKIRNIRIDIKDSISINKFLIELTNTYGTNNLIIDRDRHIWPGKKASATYTVEEQKKSWAIMLFRSETMECYVQKVYYTNANWGKYCPKKDPCEKH